MKVKGLQLEFRLTEDLSSVCRICEQRVSDKPLVKLVVSKIHEGKTTPSMVATSLYCFDCYSFVYQRRKTLEFRLPSFLALVYDVPTVVESPLAPSMNLFNLLKSCCPAEALQHYITTRS